MQWVLCFTTKRKLKDIWAIVTGLTSHFWAKSSIVCPWFFSLQELHTNRASIWTWMKWKWKELQNGNNLEFSQVTDFVFSVTSFLWTPKLLETIYASIMYYVYVCMSHIVRVSEWVSKCVCGLLNVVLKFEMLCPILAFSMPYKREKSTIFSTNPLHFSSGFLSSNSSHDNPHTTKMVQILQSFLYIE
jgi:hypothetical protein